MKGSKKAKNNNANSMNEAQLESVQGGTGIPEGRKPSDGAKGKIQPRTNGVMTLEERDDWSLYRRNE